MSLEYLILDGVNNVRPFQMGSTVMFKVMILTTIIVAAPLVVSAASLHVPAEQPTIQAWIEATVDRAHAACVTFYLSIDISTKSF